MNSRLVTCRSCGEGLLTLGTDGLLRCSYEGCGEVFDPFSDP